MVGTLTSNLDSGKNSGSKGVNRSHDRIRLDQLDITIIKDLFNEPNITSTAIAEKRHQALSTIQRRRARLEERLIKREYTIDVTKLGWRMADLSISVEKGQAKKTARDLIAGMKNNVVVATLRIGDPIVDIMANVFYKDSPELHGIIESIKAMPNVTHVEWSEIIETTESNIANMIDRVLSPAA